MGDDGSRPSAPFLENPQPPLTLFRWRRSLQCSIVVTRDLDRRTNNDRSGMAPTAWPGAGAARRCRRPACARHSRGFSPCGFCRIDHVRSGRHVAGAASPDADYAVGRGGLIAGIGDQAHASAGNFQRHYAPVINRFLEFAQLLPASESHHHAQPGGMALHTLETVQHALQRRQGLMSPPGAPTEAQQRQQHRWTYAVFVAALLYDAGKAPHDLRITYASAAHASAVWNPLAGSLPALAAERYRVDFAHGGARDYAAHRRFPLVLLPQFVPTPVLGWLAEESALLQELAEYLCGERRDGALAELVAVGDRESVRRNLLAGPRQRFASARNVPLIERLMDALRKMLADGAWLPLNRDGAAGWVADDAIWLVSKRLADEVRRFLHAQGDTAVPGEDKNDRLFDVWQEYGAVIPNPATGGAVWRARVEGADYAHELDAAAVSAGAPVAAGNPLSLAHARAHRGPADGRAHASGRASQGGARFGRTGCRPLRDHVDRIIVRPHTRPRVARPGRRCGEPGADLAPFVRVGAAGAAGDRSVAGLARRSRQTAIRAGGGVHGMGAARVGGGIAAL